MSYDETRLRANLDVALAEFMKDLRLMPGTRDAVVDHVTETALTALKLFCGDSSGARPRGILTEPTLMGYPIRVHARCDDPTCGLCNGSIRGGVVFGKPRGQR